MTNNQSKPREFWLVGDHRDFYTVWTNPEKIPGAFTKIQVIEKSAYDQLLAAQAIENEMLKEMARVLIMHHQWHLQSKQIACENGFKYDLAGEYADSHLSDETIDVLHKFEALAKIESLKRGEK